MVNLSEVEKTWRSYDGSGNNLIDPRQGKANELLPRAASADYDPMTDVAVRGPLNPSPRLISNNICQGAVLSVQLLLIWVGYGDSLLTMRLILQRLRLKLLSRHWTCRLRMEVLMNLFPRLLELIV